MYPLDAYNSLERGWDETRQFYLNSTAPPPCPARSVSPAFLSSLVIIFPSISYRRPPALEDLRMISYVPYIGVSVRDVYDVGNVGDVGDVGGTGRGIGGEEGEGDRALCPS